MGVKRETLKDGTVLRLLVEQYVRNKTNQHLGAVFGCLRDSFIWIPGTIKLSADDLHAMLNAQEGDTIAARPDVMIAPDILRHGDHLYLPVFSSSYERGEEYGSSCSWYEKHFFDAMTIASKRDDLVGIVLDAFTQPFVVPKRAFDVIRGMRSLIDEL